MTRRFFAAALAAMLVAGGGLLSAQSDVTGDWTLTINGPQGAIDTDATLTQQGDKVTGTMTSEMGETAVAGTVTGSTLSLSFNVVTPQGVLDVTMSAEVAGAEMKGTLDFGMGTADFTGKRK